MCHVKSLGGVNEVVRLFVFTFVDINAVHQCFMFGSSLPAIVCRRAHVCLIYVVCVSIVVSNTHWLHEKHGGWFISDRNCFPFASKVFSFFIAPSVFSNVYLIIAYFIWYIFSVSLIFRLKFGTVPTVWYFFSSVYCGF